MKPREFIAGIGGAAALPFAPRAQERERVRRIGVHMPTSANDPEAAPRIAAFAQGLQQLGWTVGGNVRSITAGARRTRTAFANTRRSWLRSSRTSS
jgi:putative ABC transport system substrate-binding protein